MTENNCQVHVAPRLHKACLASSQPQPPCWCFRAGLLVSNLLRFQGSPCFLYYRDLFCWQRMKQKENMGLSASGGTMQLALSWRSKDLLPPVDGSSVLFPSPQSLVLTALVWHQGEVTIRVVKPLIFRICSYKHRGKQRSACQMT